MANVHKAYKIIHLTMVENLKNIFVNVIAKTVKILIKLKQKKLLKCNYLNNYILNIQQVFIYKLILEFLCIRINVKRLLLFIKQVQHIKFEK